HDDSVKRWYINGVVQYVDTAGGNPASCLITRNNVSIFGAPQFPHGGHSQIRIARDAQLNALLGNNAGRITVRLRVNIASGWTNGFSWKYSGNDLITCAKRTMWTDMPSNTREYTWNHEVGHRFGMVAYGNRSTISGH